MVDLQNLIKHPESMDRSTLFGLRNLVALHPYYQPARLLLLQNLYLLHDPSFGDELRSAAISVGDRRKIFDMVEAAHYQLKSEEPTEPQPQAKGDRTTTLIDSFLDSMPKNEADTPQPKHGHRKPTAADAHDYVAYLMENDDEEQQEAPEMKGQSLIDDFINNDGGKIELKDNPEFVPEIDAQQTENDGNDGIFTETLARIYIKQGRYSKALEIIKRLNLLYPKKNSYFADQIRFLEKLILNEKQNN